MKNLLGGKGANQADLANLTGKRFGDPENPLLVSVRSGASISMPGLNRGRSTMMRGRSIIVPDGQINQFVNDTNGHFCLAGHRSARQSGHFSKYKSTTSS